MGGLWAGFVGLLEQMVIFCATLTGSAGFGIILFTIIARIVIFPLSLSSLRSSRRMQEVQPLIKEIQRKHGKDPQKLQEETMRLYREHKINPAGSCLPMLLQLPIFFGVYQAVYHLMDPNQRHFLSAIAQSALKDPNTLALFERPFLGLIQLGTPAFGPHGFVGPIYLVLPVLSVLFQLIQQVMATPRVQDPQQKAMTQTMLFMPLVFGYIAFTFPTGAVLYWVASSFVGIVQQYFTSGWGSLANYLKFLPVDNRPVPGIVHVPVTPSEANSGIAPAKADFWQVMRPLTEVEAVAGAGIIVDEGEGQAREEERRPHRQIQNLRRTRRARR